MRSIVCFTLAALLVGVLGGCQAPASDNQQKFASGYVPATDGFPSHKTYHSQEDYNDHYNGIDGG